MIYLEYIDGFVGDGINDDTAAVNTAILAQKNGGGQISTLGRRTIKLMSQGGNPAVSVDYDHFSWDTLSSGSTILYFGPTQTKCFLISPPNPLQFATTTLVSGASSAGGDVWMDVTNPGDFSKGRLSLLMLNLRGRTFYFVSLVKLAPGGNRIYVADPLPVGMGFSETDVHSIRPYVPLRNARMLARFDGSNISGWPNNGMVATRAVSAEYVADSYFEIEGVDFGDPANVGSASVLRMEYGRNNRVIFNGIRCGSNGETDFMLWAQTAGRFDAMSSHSLGFGPWFGLTYHSIINAQSHGSHSRGTKFYGSRNNIVPAIIGNGSGAVGVAWSYETSYNQFGAVQAIGNMTDDGRNAGNRNGLWGSDEGSVANTVGMITARANSDAQISISPSDSEAWLGEVDTDHPLDYSLDTRGIYNGGGAKFSINRNVPQGW
jgi:hypothetical protein